MNYTKLFGTDLNVSTIALGCFAFAGGQTWGIQADDDTVETIKTALDAGINFFDTAEGYGDGYSEIMLGKVVKEQRQDVVIATKVSQNNLLPKDVEQACLRSLKHLQTDYIDLYQIHWPNHDVPIEDTIGALESLKQKGIVRALGVSNFGKEDLSEYLRHGHTVSNQLPYNLLWRAIEYDIVPLCLANNISILPYSPLMQGLLTGKFKSPDDVPEGRARTRHYSGARPKASHGEAGAERETFEAVRGLEQIAARLEKPLSHVALGWLLHQPVVPSVLVGARNGAQLKDNLAAVDLSLSAEVVEELRHLTDALKENFGPNPDMWNSSTTSRYR